MLASWRAVIPDTVPLLPVGGIDSDNMADYWQAGAAGFGLGSALYKPGKKPGGHRCQRNKTGLVRDFSYQDDVGKELVGITRINLLPPSAQSKYMAVDSTQRYSLIRLRPRRESQEAWSR